MTRKSTYEILYDNFLSKLPEKYAIKLGRAFLKLPIEYLGSYEIPDERLGVRIGEFPFIYKFPNPVILAACYHEPYIIKKAMKLGFGGVTLKVTKERKKGDPYAIVRRGEGFVNCVGFENLGMEEYRKFLESYKRTKPLILNITGDGIYEYFDVIEYLEKYADMFELNISCPNTESGLKFSKHPEKTLDLFRGSRELTNKPLIVKLSPDREFEENNYKKIIPYAIDSEMDVINFGNTELVKEERLPKGFGGWSGPELFENTLRDVEKIYRNFGRYIFVMATGGIYNPERAYKAIAKGATCISSATGPSKKGSLFAKGINRYLLEKVEEYGLDSVEDLVGFELRGS